MTLHLDTLGPLWFAYIIADDDRLLACGRPRACPIEAVHQAAGEALGRIFTHHDRPETTKEASK